jgi:hypothetical protein
MLYLEDVNLYILAGELLQLLLQLINLGTTLTDNHTWACGRNSYGYELQSTLDDNL